MGKFYVYEHWRPDRGECFYVGKGSRTRAYRMRGRNRRHLTIQRILARDGLRVEVKLFKCGMTEDEAFAVERERISHWTGRGFFLANMTEGGEGRAPRFTRHRPRPASNVVSLQVYRNLQVGRR